ncbi:MAG: tetratricopeptide repeat protein [Bacteroidales bacterium]
MKLRALAIFATGMMALSLSAQTLTDVINEFNDGVAMVNSQEYLASVDHFNQVLTLAEAVGDSATDMKLKAEEQIPLAYYRQATLFLKRRQFDNAIPVLEKTIETADAYGNNDESKEKATRYLMQSYMVEGQRTYKNKSYDEALDYFDKALQMNPDLYQAHQGKGMVYMDQDEPEKMLEEFNIAKEGAAAAGKTETVDEINGVIDAHFNKFITEEMEMVDPEDNDYTYVVESCEKALAANPNNPFALYHMALVKNKEVEYDAAIEYAEKALEYETDPVWISAINFELGSAYQNTVDYEKACEALKKVVEEPFLSRAEKKLSSIPGCQ